MPIFSGIRRESTSTSPCNSPLPSSQVFVRPLGMIETRIYGLTFLIFGHFVNWVCTFPPIQSALLFN